MDFLKKSESKGPLSCDTILKIFYQVCRAVQHMHRQKPPIIHRDLKVPCPPAPSRSAGPAWHGPGPVCEASDESGRCLRHLNPEAGYGDSLAGA